MKEAGLRVRLTDLCEIHSGYSFRSGISPEPEGTIRVVQTKNLSDQGIEVADLTRVKDPGFREHHFLSEGDLVFRSRGNSWRTVEARGFTGPVALSAPLVRLRPKSNLVLSPFLIWSMNHESIQSQLSSRARGSSILLLSAQDLGDLTIEVPSRETQNTIVVLLELQQRESVLTARLLDARQRLFNHIATALATHGETNGQ